MKRAFLAAILGFPLAASPAISALSGCSSARPPAAKEPAAQCTPPDPEIAISASDRVNATSAGQGSPVQVRIYQLKSDARLLTAKFEDIWQNDAATLDKDLVKMDEHTIYPGAAKSVKIARNPEAHTLAAVALFREPQGKSWYLTYELATPGKDQPCPKSGAHISVWLDRMQIEDGQGRPTSAAPPASEPSREPEPSAGGKGH